MLSARLSRYRMAHNALAVSLLHPDGRNAPILRAPPQVPNGARRGDTSGGLEYRLIEQLQATMAHLAGVMERDTSDSAAQVRTALQLKRAELALVKARADLEAYPTPSTPGGMRDTYTVIVPALHVRVQGDAYTADLVRLQIAVNPDTARYGEYLGRGKLRGHGGTGPQPLYKVRSDASGLALSSEARDWHAVMIAQLWPAPRLPELRPVLFRETVTV